MKTALLVPILFVALLLAGCQHPDDDVDMPKPGKSVAEMIKGEWVLYERTMDSYWEGQHNQYIDSLNQFYRFNDQMLYFGSLFERGEYECKQEENDEEVCGYVPYFYNVYEASDISPYYLLLQENKTFIHYNAEKNPQEGNFYSGDWLIASITDSTMVWTQTYTGTHSMVTGHITTEEFDYTYKFRRNKPSEY